MKRLILRASAFIAALTVGVQLYAAPPANDNLANAQELASEFGALIVDTTDATREDAETRWWYYYGETNTVWYKWTSSAAEKIPFYLRASSMDGKYACARVSVFSGTSYDDLSMVSSGYSVDLCAEPGKTYLIRLSTYGESGPGKVALRWWRHLAEGEWKILAADGIVLGAVGDLPKDLTAADFPAGVTEIAKYAFDDTEGVRFVTIPATVTKIGEYAFAWSEDLAWVDYEGDVAAVTVSDTAFLGTPYGLELPFNLILDKGVCTNVEWNADCTAATTNLEEYCGVEGFVGTCPAELVIPEGVTAIYCEAFSGVGNESLAKVTFPSTLKYVDEWAFYGCDALKEVAGIPADAEVSNWAFYGSLYEEVRPFEFATYESIRPDCDSWDSELGDYTKYTTNTWVYGFHGTCPEEVVFPEGIYGIDEEAFSLNMYEQYDDYSGNLLSVANIKKVTLPASVKVIDEGAFFGLPNLEEVVFAGNKDEVEIGYLAFVGTPYYENQEFTLTTYWDVVDWDEYGNPVSSNLWVSGYSGSKPPETIVIPEGTHGIGWNAFGGLKGVTAVTIPASVQCIDGYAFADCEDLATVTFLGNKDDIYISEYAFLQTPYCASLPFELLAYWAERDGYWKSLYDEYGNWTNDVWVAFDELKSYWTVYGYVGTCPAKLDLTQYLTNDVGFVDIEEDTFADSDTLTELVLPNAEYRSSGAFRNCANLATVTVGGDNATDKAWLTSNFQGTPWLDTVVPFEFITKSAVVTNITSVYKKDYNCCTDSDEMRTIVTNITTFKKVIGFYGNVPATLTFPEDVGEIGSYVFADCDNITEVVVPGNVKQVGSGAFQYCDSLQSVEFEEGVETLGGRLFLGCGDGMQVILPASAVVGHYVAIAGNPSDDDFIWRGVPVTWRSAYLDYCAVFDGIDGDVDVVAPRATYIQDRAFYYNYYCDSRHYFGRTCVEHYTHVVLDPNGGTLEGATEYRCFDDVVTGLPTPVLSGNVFREWWDDEDTLFRNGDVWDEDDAQVYLKAQWAGKRTYTVYGLNGPVEIELGAGDDYETLLRVLEEAYGTVPQASRHGLTFRYWTVDGDELNHRSVIGEDSTFGAYFDEFNPLSDNPEAAVDSAAAQTYDGYILDFKGDNAGTIQVKVGKPNKKTGEASVSASVQMRGEKKFSFKADPKGKWKLAVGEATKDVTLSSPKVADKIVIDISEKGIFGTFGTYDIIGARNTSKKDAAYAKWSGKTYDIVFKTKEGTGSAFTGGYSGVTVSIANKGKVKIAGVMADGEKINASAQLLISDKGEGCINVSVPMYAGKKGGFGFVLWIDPDYKTTYVESVNTWVCTDKKVTFTAELELVGIATLSTPTGAMTFTLETVPAVSGATVLAEFLPTAVRAEFIRGKLTVAKANKIKVDKAGAATRTGTTDNDAGLKLTYTAKNSSFKGSFTVYTLVNSKLKKLKADVNGVFVNGIGYGTAFIKGVGSFPVSIHP